MRRKRYSRVGILAAVFLMMAVWLAEPVFASGRNDYESGRECSILIELEDLGTPKEGSDFCVYQIGTVNADIVLQFQILDVYRDAGIDLNSLVLAEDQENAAKKFSGMLNQDTLVKDGSTDRDGKLDLGPLAQGVYLVVQKSTANYGKVDPFLVFLPYYIEDNGEYQWVYDLTVSPKALKLQKPSKDPEPEQPKQEPENPPKSEGIHPLRTGDSQNLIGYLLLAVLSMGVLWASFRWRKKGD